MKIAALPGRAKVVLARAGSIGLVAAVVMGALVSPASAEPTTRLTVVLGERAPAYMEITSVRSGDPAGTVFYGSIIEGDWRSRAMTRLVPGNYQVGLNRSNRSSILPSGWMANDGSWVSDESGVPPEVTVGPQWREVGPLVVPRGGALTGRVVDTAGQEIVVQRVTATSTGGSAPREGRTDGTSNIVIPGLSTASYHIQVSIPGQEVWLAETPQGRLLTTVEGVTPVTATLGMTRNLGEVVAPDVFTDVRAGNQFVREIAWARDSGVANGYPDGSFGALMSVNRDAMAAFLYRRAGEPVFEPPVVSPFSDVPTGAQFYKEIAWLASTGISTGWPDGTFRPLAPVSRDAMAAFLFRYPDTQDRWAGTPLSSTTGFVAPASSPFVDVAPTNPFYREITWAAARSITTGWPDSTFRPSQSVNRDAMTAFLRRISGA